MLLNDCNHSGTAIFWRSAIVAIRPRPVFPHSECARRCTECPNRDLNENRVSMDLYQVRTMAPGPFSRLQVAQTVGPDPPDPTPSDWTLWGHPTQGCTGGLPHCLQWRLLQWQLHPAAASCNRLSTSICCLFISASTSPHHGVCRDRRRPLCRPPRSRHLRPRFCVCCPLPRPIPRPPRPGAGDARHDHDDQGGGRPPH